MHDVVAEQLGLVKANHCISAREEQTSTRLVGAQNTKYEAPHNGKFTVRNLTRPELNCQMQNVSRFASAFGLWLE